MSGNQIPTGNPYSLFSRIHYTCTWSSCTIGVYTYGRPLTPLFTGLVTLDVIDVDSTVGVGAHGQCKLHKRSIKVNIDAITKMFKRRGRLIQNLEGFGTEVIIIGQKVLQALEEVDNEEIKRLYQVDEALHHIKSVAEIAYTFLDRVNDVIYYCQGDSMAAAKGGLSSSPRDLKPLRNLMHLLENSLKKAENNYAELMGASSKAICSCDEAAQGCESKERELRKKKGAARGIGGTAAGALMVASGGAVAGGVAASVVAGVFTFGIGTVVGLGLTAAAGVGLGAAGAAAGAGTVALTRYIANKYKKAEASFRNVRDGFKAVLDCAHNLKEEVAQVHTIQGNLAAQVDNIELSLEIEDITLIKDTLERLNMVCTDSYDITSKCRDQVKSMMDKLNDRIK